MSRAYPARVRPVRPAGIAPVDRVEQITELRRRDRNGAIRRARPDEPAMFETLGVKRQADAVVPENLDHIAATASENEEIAGVWITPKPFLNLQRHPFMPRRMSVTPPASQTRTPEGTEIMIGAPSRSP